MKLFATGSIATAMRATIVAAVATTSFLAAQSAQATSYCNVKQTKDGFVALRDRPSLKARVIGRMKPGDEVLIGQGKEGDWLEVTWWHGLSRLDNSGAGKPRGRGWVSGKLLDTCG